MNKSKIIVIIIFFLIMLFSLSKLKSADENSYHISEYKCVGCEACMNACPVQAISMEGGKAIIDQTKCIQCGICVGGNFADYIGCPTQAIKPPKEENDINPE
jgi:ferredoxin